MPTRVQLPDGSIGEFPDSMSQQQIQTVLQKQFPPQKASPPNSVIGGAGRRTVAIAKGLAQTFGRPKSTLDYFAGPALPLLRMGEGAVQSGVAAGKQAVQQVKEAHAVPAGNKALKTLGYAHALTTGLAALNPFASGTVANVNQLESEGRSREAAGQALPDLALLAGPKIISPMLRRGTEMISGTGTKAAETLAKDAGEANKTATQEHLEKTQDALHQTKGAELTHQQKLAQAKEAADAENKANLKKHLESRDTAVRERAEAEQKLIAEKAAQGKIGPTQAKLQTAWSNLRAGIETARNNALKVGNEKYSAVNEKLNAFPADMETVNGLYHAARESIGETQAEPPVLKRLGTSLEHGEELSYKDLQSMYSELGRELSKGTLPGGLYHAYGVLQEGIGDDMQRIANSQGEPIDTVGVPRKMVDGKPTEDPAYTTDMGKQLFDARNYWRRMKQTFGKQFAMNDAATGALKHSASGLATEDAEANQIRLLGSFDPDIPKLFSHISNIEKGADALPKPVSARELEQGTKAPAIPPRKPVLPKVEPKPVAPPERVAPPDRPATTTITPEAVQNAKAAAMRVRAGHIAGRGSLIATWPLYHVFSAIARGAPGEIGTMGLESGATLAGVQMVARILRDPRAVEFLSKATPRDVAAIPPELRSGNWQAVIDGAKKRGIPISPAILALANPPRPRHPVFSAQSPVQ